MRHMKIKKGEEAEVNQNRWGSRMPNLRFKNNELRQYGRNDQRRKMRRGEKERVERREEKGVRSSTMMSRQFDAHTDNLRGLLFLTLF
jgi:hypothetical protein